VPWIFDSQSFTSFAGYLLSFGAMVSLQDAASFSKWLPTGENKLRAGSIQEIAALPQNRNCRTCRQAEVKLNQHRVACIGDPD